MLNQLAVFVENQPGKLKEVTSWVREQNVEFYAFVCFDNPEFGIFRFICDDPDKMICDESGTGVGSHFDQRIGRI